MKQEVKSRFVFILQNHQVLPLLTVVDFWMNSNKSVLETVLLADVERTRLLDTEKALLEEQRTLPDGE